ncbi:hypothetical protein [Burkholderia sp. JKS000303]|uniref:hypothetical protein n=1 Tax=Burkholderia sp. JKS000303 TaxID=1938747 RepID=UPI000C012EBE|nr:hypothetical protein [Burkholderia sp. JKS000303]PFH29132.1 hypothetical protein BX604_2904 [Burkholderia sp. JKS000303]
MSDLNATQGADGATNGAAGAPADAAPSSSEPAFPTDAGGAPVGELVATGATAAAGASADSSSPGAGAMPSSAPAAATSTPPADGDAGAAARAPSTDGAAADAGAALEADAANLLGEAINDAPVAAVAAVVATIPLMVRVEQLALRAFESGATGEHNLMAWLHQHMDALLRAIAGAPGLPLTDDAKALIAELKALL